MKKYPGGEASLRSLRDPKEECTTEEVCTKIPWDAEGCGFDSVQHALPNHPRGTAPLTTRETRK